MPIRRTPGTAGYVTSQASLADAKGGAAPSDGAGKALEAPATQGDARVGSSRPAAARPDEFRPAPDFTRALGDAPLTGFVDDPDTYVEPEPLLWEPGMTPPPGVPLLERPERRPLDPDTIAANKAEALAGPTTVAGFAAAGVTGHHHSPAEKEALRQLLLANMGEGEDHPFPDPGSSAYGLNVYLPEGPYAAHTVAFLQAAHGIKVPLDLEKHSLFLTMRWRDEWPSVGIFVYDRERQELIFSFEEWSPKYDAKLIDKFFPTRFPPREPMRHAIGSLAQNGELLAFIKDADVPSEYTNYAWWGP